MSAEAEAQIQPHKKYSRPETRWKEDYGGKKDISEKNLEALNDVFADITNTLLFGGERIISESELEAALPRSLLECLDIPEPLKPYVNDYPLHIFEIAQLTEEQVERFQSDFRIIADYFVQLRRHQRYTPQGTRLRHPQETLRLMSVLTNDRRFEESCNNLMEEGKEVQNMCEVLDRIEARGEARGRAEGEARGRLHTLYALAHDRLLSAAVAAERADMTEEQFLSGMKTFYL